MKRSRLGDPLHLHDHQPAGVVHRGGDGQGLQKQRLALHGDVAVRVGGGAPKERDVEPLECLVEQVLLTVDRHQLDPVFGGAFVDLPAAVAGIDKRVEANPGQQPGLTRGGIAEQLRDHALRQVVGLDLVLHGHLAELTRHPPVPPDGPLEQAFVAQPVRAPPLPVSLCHGERQRQIPRGAGLQESRLQRQGEFFGETLPGEAFHDDGVAVTDQRDGLGGGDDLVPRCHARHEFGWKLHVVAPVRRRATAIRDCRAAQVKALNPVMSRPTSRVWIVSVPSNV